MTEWIQCGDTLRRPFEGVFLFSASICAFPFCESPSGLAASHGKCCAPQHFYTGYFSCMERRGVSPQSQPSGDLLCAVAYFVIKKHACYVFICFSARLHFSLCGVAAHPGSDQTLCPIMQEQQLYEGPAWLEQSEIVWKPSSASRCQDLKRLKKKITQCSHVVIVLLGVLES